MKDIQIFESVSVVTFSDIKSGTSFMSDVLSVVAEADINIDMISRTPPKSEMFSFGFSFSDNDFASLLTAMSKITTVHNITPFVNSGNIKIVIKSEEMIEHGGFAAKVFSITETMQSQVLLVTTGIDEISLLVSPADAEELCTKLKEIL